MLNTQEGQKNWKSLGIIFFLLICLNLSCGGGGGSDSGSGGGGGAANPVARSCGGTAIYNEWSISTLDCGAGQYGRVGRASSIAVDSGDKIHISYHEDDPLNRNALKYATNSSGSWNIIYIDAINPFIFN